MLQKTFIPSTASSASFVDILESSDGWHTIDELVSILDDSGYWVDGFHAKALSNAKKAHVRSMIRRLKDKDGFPLFPSVRITDEEGGTRRVYKQELLFDLEDYRAVVDFHANLSSHHRRMAKGYADRCEKRYRVQLSLWDLEVKVDDHDYEEWTDPRNDLPNKPR
jgi:hypothetical protein